MHKYTHGNSKPSVRFCVRFVICRGGKLLSTKIRRKNKWQ